MCDASEGERSDAWESLFVPFGAGMYKFGLSSCERESSRSRRCYILWKCSVYLKFGMKLIVVFPDLSEIQTPVSPPKVVIYTFAAFGLVYGKLIIF